MNTHKKGILAFRLALTGLLFWLAAGADTQAYNLASKPKRLAAKVSVDTINTQTIRLKSNALKAGKSTYAVFFEDSTGKRLSTADLWDREVILRKDDKGKAIYQFSWKWYNRDSLRASVTATGDPITLKPFTHQADYGKRGKFAFTFTDNVVTIPDGAKRTKRDSLFRVVLDLPAFEFPMDLEIFPLLPFRTVGQQFALAFYEPGSPKADYYKATVTGKETIATVGGAQVSCWLLRMEYGQGSYATFWIADKTKEVVKMKEYFRGRYRYKVKLY